VKERKSDSPSLTSKKSARPLKIHTALDSVDSPADSSPSSSSPVTTPKGHHPTKSSDGSASHISTPRERDSLSRALSMASPSKIVLDDSSWEVDLRELEFIRSLGMGSSGEVFLAYVTK